MGFDVFDDFEEGQAGSGKDLRNTGVYDVKLIRVGINTNRSGSQSITVTVDNGGKFNTTFYQGVVQNADGSNGWENGKLLQPIRVICGAKSLTPETITIDVKNGTKEVDVFMELKDTEMKIAVQRQWSDYKSEYETKIVAAFFKDGRSAKEVQSGVTVAEQIKYYLSEKFQDKGPKGGKPTANKKVGVDTTLDVDPNDIF